MIDTALKITALVAEILRLANEVSKDLQKKATLSLVNPFRDMRTQLDRLIYPGFVAHTGAAQLVHLPRYLKGMLMRIERLTTVGGVGQDQQNLAEIQKLEAALDNAREQLSTRGSTHRCSNRSVGCWRNCASHSSLSNSALPSPSPANGCGLGYGSWPIKPAARRR